MDHETDNGTINAIAGFIENIDNHVMCGVCVRGKYRDVILFGDDRASRALEDHGHPFGLEQRRSHEKADKA